VSRLTSLCCALAQMCMYMVACLAAWPLSQSRRGVDTAFRPTVEEAAFNLPFPHVVYAVKIFVTMLFADAHTFWKHYLLHRPSVYPFHKYHHQFHNVRTTAFLSETQPTLPRPLAATLFLRVLLILGPRLGEQHLWEFVCGVPCQ
jgi:sterol desaturase/sphingolipid hydroxylase (fatty acid hydroxylase superfamily)